MLQSLDRQTLQRKNPNPNPGFHFHRLAHLFTKHFPKVHSAVQVAVWLHSIYMVYKTNSFCALITEWLNFPEKSRWCQIEEICWSLHYISTK